ncbi:hypothetical protein RFI_33465, partial [Reticulomyxa filosa]
MHTYEHNAKTKHRLDESKRTQISEVMKDIPFSNAMDAMNFCKLHNWSVTETMKQLLNFVMESREAELSDAIYFCDMQKWDADKIQENLLRDNFKWNSTKSKHRSKKVNSN